MGDVIWATDVVLREATLFAAIGLFIGGIDDLVVDLIFLVRAMSGRRAPWSRMADLPVPDRSAPIAIFVPAWDEAPVIGAMLKAAVARYRHDRYQIFVGLYPNDRATIDAVSAIAATDPRIHPIIGERPGPTTKADCLNALWHAMIAEGPFKAVVLHDAEDVVHADELTIFDAAIDHYAVVQLPVLPLVKPGSRLVSGHYADEFAEAHAKQIVVRSALGAGIPLAGVGCAIAVPMLTAIARARHGDPFDAASLTEDYELGLDIAARGGRSLFARIRADDGHMVAVRAYFPATISTAVRQKARWMIGIALAGWDRIGWARPLAIGDHWMRMRDRRAPLAVLIIAAAYLALAAWALSALFHRALGGTPVVTSATLFWILVFNMTLLVWRLIMRMVFTHGAYGWREACWAVPRLVVGNYIALLAARRAMWRYLLMLGGRPLSWDKTGHEFPDLAAVSLK